PVLFSAFGKSLSLRQRASSLVQVALVGVRGRQVRKHPRLAKNVLVRAVQSQNFFECRRSLVQASHPAENMRLVVQCCGPTAAKADGTIGLDSLIQLVGRKQ